MLLTLACCMFIGAVSGWNKAMENPNLYGGDMVLTPEQTAELRDGKLSYGSHKARRWPNAVIPYVIHRSLGSTARAAIQAALNDYHKYTCLKFRSRNGERAYIQFWKGGGCSSPVGYLGQRNDISLGDGCWDKGTALHEIGHSIGLYHEQNRPDRDKYVRIHTGNIIGGMGYNFQKEYDINSLGTPYDLRSMMHYSSIAFQKSRRLKTITTVDSSQQRLIDTNNWITGFSDMDIKQINMMYNCGGVKPPTAAPPSGGCDNKEKDCVYWAKNGYCTDKKEAQYMKDNCCKACKEHTACPDLHDRCQEWADRGECQKNPNYMLRNCRKSCKQC